MVTTFTVNHLATDGNVLVGRRTGKKNGRTTPLRLYFELGTHYDISECNGTADRTVDVIYPSGTYEELNYVPIWEHHRFYGWYATATTPSQLEDTSGRNIVSADSIVYSIKTVYARWQIPMTVTFDATSGGGAMPGGWTSPDYYAGQPFGTLPQPTKTDEVFLGWFTADGTRITESSIVPSTSTVLTARYQYVNYATKLEVIPTSSYKKFGIYSATAMDALAPTVVDWGDGTYDVVYGDISQLVHEYSVGGIYEVGISDSITSLGISGNNSTWYNTTSHVRYTMKKVKAISSNILTYPAYAFNNCSAMTDVLFPSSQSFTNIPSYCFNYCSSIKNLTIPSSVTTISTYAFANCNSSNFNTITIPATVTSIGSSGFNHCDYLNSITFEAGDTLALEQYAFAYCGYYSRLDMDLSSRIVANIPDYCFYYCRYLGAFSFPRNCTSIGSNAFTYAWSQSATGVSTLDIPEGLTSIGGNSFRNAYYLSEITIPSSCSTIGNQAFNYTRRLATIRCNRATAPTVYSGTFGTGTTYYTGRDTYSSGTNRLIVPDGATGYEYSYWADPLCNASKCGFTLEYAGGAD